MFVHAHIDISVIDILILGRQNDPKIFQPAAGKGSPLLKNINIEISMEIKNSTNHVRDGHRTQNLLRPP